MLQIQRRPVACYACAKLKKKCIFPTTQSENCESCLRRGLRCFGGGVQSQRSGSSQLVVVQPQSPNPIGQSSMSWKMSSRQLSFSLTHHLISLHIRHRTPRMFAGVLEMEWDGIADISQRVNGKMDELSPIVQALVALGLADGARLSTHSAIVGASTSPFPHFGSFSSVDDSLSTLGRRRRDAVDQLNAKAMECIDDALSSPEGMVPEMKMQMIWIGTSMVVETPLSRTWCRDMASRCVKYIIESLGREGVDAASANRLYQQSYYVVLLESLRCSSGGIQSPFLQSEYMTAVPYMAYPSPPIYFTSPAEYDLILTSHAKNADFTPLHAFLENLFLPWRIRYIKVVFFFTYGESEVELTRLVTLIWEWLDKIYAFVDEIVENLLADPRYVDVEKSRGTPKWASYVLLQMLYKHLFVAESIYGSLTLGCHLKLVKSSIQGAARHRLLSFSQKRCYETYRRAEFICGLREIVLDFREYDPLVRLVQLMAASPENGPCSSISLLDFPNLLKAFEFMSFSNAECGEFLRKCGKKSLVPTAPRRFADGTFVSDLPPRTLVSPVSTPDYFSTKVPRKEQIACDMVEVTLKSLSVSEDFDGREIILEECERDSSSVGSPPIFSNESTPAAVDTPLTSVASSPSTLPFSQTWSETSITSRIEAVVLRMITPQAATVKTRKEQLASDLVESTLEELSEEELSTDTLERLQTCEQEALAAKFVQKTLKDLK